MQSIQTKNNTLESVIQATQDLATAFDLLAFGERAEVGQEKPSPTGEVNRLKEMLGNANVKLDQALQELRNLK